jgi:hypothetical protein
MIDVVILGVLIFGRLAVYPWLHLEKIDAFILCAGLVVFAGRLVQVT